MPQMQSKPITPKTLKGKPWPKSLDPLAVNEPGRQTKAEKSQKRLGNSVSKGKKRKNS